MALPWPLTGRSEEMRLIEAALFDPTMSGIVISGTAGVGKSRIAREALSIAESKGRLIRWAVGTSSARALPLGAIASWLDTEGDALELVRRLIESLTSQAPAVLAVDDVHLIDDLSAFVLYQIVQRRAAHVLLTVRDGDRVPQAVAELWKDHRFERLDLQPLSRDETATLLSVTLDGSIAPDAEARLWRLTRGNILYLRNIVDQEVAEGRFAQRNRVWEWTGEPIVPPRLVELIESRIAGLPSSTSDVLDVLAVGEPLELSMLMTIADPAAVEEADKRGLITVQSADDRVEVWVAHPLYGEVRRRRTAATRLRRIRALVADQLAVADDGNDMPVVVRRAALTLDSDLEPDPDLFLRAAQGAVSLGDLLLADRLTDAATRSGAGIEARLLRFGVLSWLSRGDDADALLADIPVTDVSGTDWGRIIFSRAINRLMTLGDPAGAKKIVDDASPGAPPEARPCIDGFLAVHAAAMGDASAAIAASNNFVLEEIPDVIAAAVAWGVVAAYGDAGRYSDAVKAASEAYGVMTRSRDAAHMRYVIADSHIGAVLLCGHVNDALDMAEQLRTLAADHPGMEPLYSTALAGRAALGAGRLDTARSLLGRAADALAASGESNGWMYRYQLPLATTLAMCGLSVEASAAQAALEKQRHPSRQYLDYERAIAHAWVSACQGAVSESVTIVLAAAEKAHTNGQLAGEVMCLQTAAHFGDDSSAPRLRELEAVVEGPRVGLAARFAEALQRGDGAELAEVSEGFEQMGDLVAAVDAAAHAAIVYRRQGRSGSAIACGARAEGLADQCGGASTPALRRATERVPLTNREREIVMLIGEGLSNRAIADRLTLSTRTVEGHIYRAMEKTGADSRGALAALLPRHQRRQ